MKGRHWMEPDLVPPTIVRAPILERRCDQCGRSDIRQFRGSARCIMGGTDPFFDTSFCTGSVFTICFRQLLVSIFSPFSVKILSDT